MLLLIWVGVTNLSWSWILGVPCSMLGTCGISIAEFVLQANTTLLNISTSGLGNPDHVLPSSLNHVLGNSNGGGGPDPSV